MYCRSFFNHSFFKKKCPEFFCIFLRSQTRQGQKMHIAHRQKSGSAAFVPGTELLKRGVRLSQKGGKPPGRGGAIEYVYQPRKPGIKKGTDTMKNAIMKAAHEMTRETLRKYPGTNYRATFAAALRIAWEEARAADAIAAAAARLAVAVVLQSAADAVTRRAADVEAAAAEIVADMPKLSDEMPLAAALEIVARDAAAGEELAARLKKAAAAAPYRMLRQIRKTTTEAGEIVYTITSDPRAFWMLPESVGGLALMPWADAVETVAGEAFIVLYDKVSLWEEKPLKYAAYDAAAYAVARCEKGVRDRARRARKAENRGDASYMENPDGIPGYHAPAPEKIAITRATLAALAQDDDDKRIINGLLRGMTQKELAAAVGRTQGFISKRIARMKANAADM